MRKCRALLNCAQPMSPPRPAALAPFALLLAAVASEAARAAETYVAETADGRKLTGTLEIRDGRLSLQGPTGPPTRLEPTMLRRLVLSSAIQPPRPPTPPASDIRVGTPVGVPSVRTEGDRLFLRSDSCEIEGVNESLHLLGWRSTGEFELTSRLLAVAPDAPARGPAAPADSAQEVSGRVVGGLMLRQDDSAQCPFVAIALDAGGDVRLIFRRDTFRQTETVPIAARAGGWFRLVREEHRARVLTSNDGVAWREVWSMSLRQETNAVAGAYVAPRAGTATLSLASLAFDPSSQAVADGCGVMLVGGTFLAGDVQSVDDREVWMIHTQRDPKLDRSAVAWFCSTRLTRLELARLARAGPSALIHNDDLVEGTLQVFRNDRATFDTLLFGRRTIEPAGGGWHAVYFQPVTAARAPRYTLETTASDIMVGNAVTVDKDGLRIDANGVPAEVRLVPLNQLRSLASH